MTKDEARREAVRRWRELPIRARQNFEQAEAFAGALAETMEFRTMANRRHLIAAWLIRDIQDRDAIVAEMEKTQAEARKSA